MFKFSKLCIRSESGVHAGRRGRRAFSDLSHFAPNLRARRSCRVACSTVRAFDVSPCCVPIDIFVWNVLWNLFTSGSPEGLNFVLIFCNWNYSNRWVIYKILFVFKKQIKSLLLHGALWCTSVNYEPTHRCYSSYSTSSHTSSDILNLITLSVYIKLVLDLHIHRMLKEDPLSLLTRIYL